MSRINDFTQLRHFRAAGPVSAAFIGDDQSVVPAILGPVGGGKSVSCVYKGIRRASRMPVCNDGVIRYRRVIVGSTYGQLERNLYPTWKRWLPEDGGDFTPVSEWKGGGGRSAEHRLEWDVVRGTKLVTVFAEFIFAAVGEQAIEDFVRGFEPTDAWFYEMDLLPRALVQSMIPRLGRYPATSETEPDALTTAQASSYQPQLCGDLNAPDIDSWFFQDFEEAQIPGYRVYKQPSGLSPRAENRGNLRPDYYETQVALLSKQAAGRHLVKRMVHAQYAPSLDGEPVYPEYDDATHLAGAPLAPLPGLSIVMGFDQGVQRPAAVIAQVTPSGQYRLLAECVPGRMNARRFAEAVRNTLLEVAPGVPLAEVHYCDPAGFTGADREAGDLAWAEVVAAELGVVILPCETNELDPRLTAVKDELTYSIGPGEPALLVSPVCQMLRKGFASHYRYAKTKVGGGERTSDKPEKNDWSNPHDALQYLLLGLKGRSGVIAGRRDPRAPERRHGRQADAGDSVQIRAPVII
jgi:hypothetical protein